MNRLKDLREDHDWTQPQVAAMFNVHFTTVSKWELGTNALTDDVIRKFCEIYGVTADYLLGLSNQPHAAVSDSDTELLRAYDAAPDNIKAIVNTALAPYREKDRGASAS